MSERIQQLLVEVRRAAEDPEYRPRLGTRFPDAAAQSMNQLQREIVEEIAYSLGKAGRKLELRIRVLELLLTRKRQEPFSADELVHLHQEFEQQRARAQREFLDLVIQREALGFRRHTELELCYPIPHWVD